MNLGNLMRSAHAFGASFFFVVAPVVPTHKARHADTSDSPNHLPLYTYDTVDDLVLPKGCALVGVEFTPEAVELPSFYHPSAAAYVLGPERGALSAAMTARCGHMVKIPTKFCINLGVAGAILMYDRQVSRGNFPRRPVNPRGPAESAPRHVRGAQLIRRQEGKA